MAEFTIEGSGRLEKTALYFNGEQLDKVREVFLNVHEDGTFDAFIEYVNLDGRTCTKGIFTDYLDKIQTEPPGFTEDEARSMRQLTIVSSGNLESTTVLIDGEEQTGIVSLYVHIKAPSAVGSSGLRSFLRGKKDISAAAEFRAEITFREADGSLTEQGVF